MSDFLPDNYQAPAAGGNYMKFESGDNKFRALSSAIVGWELWIDGKPVRRKTNDFTPEELAHADINKFNGKKRTPVHFWAFVVWNYQEEKVQILEIKQKTVRDDMENFINDEDYGSPKNYDVVVTQSEGDNGMIKYQTRAKPPKEVDEGIAIYAKDLNINLNALYEGEDPFKAEDLGESFVKEMEKENK